MKIIIDNKLEIVNNSKLRKVLIDTINNDALNAIKTKLKDMENNCNVEVCELGVITLTGNKSVVNTTLELILNELFITAKFVENINDDENYREFVLSNESINKRSEYIKTLHASHKYTITIDTGMCDVNNQQLAAADLEVTNEMMLEVNEMGGIGKLLDIDERASLDFDSLMNVTIIAPTKDIAEKTYEKFLAHDKQNYVFDLISEDEISKAYKISVNDIKEMDKRFTFIDNIKNL